MLRWVFEMLDAPEKCLVINKCTVAEIESASTFKDLVDEYAKECAIDGLPKPSVRMELYRKIENSGSFCVWGAFYDKILVGFITLLATVIPHYGVSVAVSESFFVGKDYRFTGAGNALRHAAQDHTKNIGSPGLLISAPTGSILAEVLPRCDYVETNRVFFWKTKNA